MCDECKEWKEKYEKVKRVLDELYEEWNPYGDLEEYYILGKLLEDWHSGQ